MHVLGPKNYHYKYLFVLTRGDEINYLLAETSDPLLFTNKAQAHGFAHSTEISPHAFQTEFVQCIEAPSQNRSLMRHKGF